MPTTKEVLYQSLIAFLVLLLVARVLGKRQIAQLTFFDYIAGISMGSIAASWSLDEIKSIHAVVSLGVWALLSIALVVLQRNFYWGRVLLDGRPKVLIREGKILEKNLKKAKLSTEELMLLLRNKNIFKLSDVEYAVFENNGTLSVMKTTLVQPATPKDLGVEITAEHEPRVLVIDGNLMQKSLHQAGYDTDWLLRNIRKHGATQLEDVFFAQVDSAGNLYVDLYEDDDRKQSAGTGQAVLFRQLESQLRSLADHANDEQAKTTFVRTAAQLKALYEEVRPHLKP